MGVELIRAERRTDGHNEANGHFRGFAEGAYNNKAHGLIQIMENTRMIDAKLITLYCD